MPDFRCSFASVEDDEPIIGTRPTDTEILLVESPGPWGRDAVSDNRLPEVVRDHLGRWTSRSSCCAGTTAAPVPARGSSWPAPPRTATTSAARCSSGPRTCSTSTSHGMPAYDGPLWLVCTNGKRDRCCAELGRPIAGLLSQEWPEGTWETTHLGGHRFSGTLLALPSGLTLGRLDTYTALDACEAVERGEVPLQWVRGRAGRSGVDQARELHVLAGGDPDDEIRRRPGPVRRRSRAATTRSRAPRATRSAPAEAVRGLPTPRGVWDGGWRATDDWHCPGRTVRRGAMRRIHDDDS